MNSIISTKDSIPHLDSFIYAVRQAFDARSRANGEFNSHLKYTPFLENTWEKPAESDISTLKEPLNEICKHHWNAIPQYQKHETLNLENISWFAHSMAALISDINFLLKSVLGHGIPQKSIEENDSSKVWALIDEAILNNFKEYAPLFNAYAEWKYTPSSEKKEAVDWNVRPPCGMLYRTEFKALFDEIRNERFGKKNSKFDRKGDDKHDKNSKPERNENDRTNNAEHKDKKNFDRKEKSTDRGRDNRDNRDNRERGPRPKREPRNLENSEQLLPAALDECKKAIETMKNNPNVHEIPLSAQNSFIRRHQHTFVTEAGFDSDSRGEGNGRHVCIIKKTS